MPATEIIVKDERQFEEMLNASNLNIHSLCMERKEEVEINGYVVELLISYRVKKN